eukprot:SAG22_NODE_6102_length_898_cov_1.359199_2_plen_152_part_01
MIDFANLASRIRACGAMRHAHAHACMRMQGRPAGAPRARHEMKALGASGAPGFPSAGGDGALLLSSAPESGAYQGGGVPPPQGASAAASAAASTCTAGSDGDDRTDLDSSSSGGATLSYGLLFAATWRLLLVSTLLDMHSEVDDKIMTPFLY